MKSYPYIMPDLKNSSQVVQEFKRYDGNFKSIVNVFRPQGGKEFLKQDTECTYPKD